MGPKRAHVKDPMLYRKYVGMCDTLSLVHKVIAIDLIPSPLLRGNKYCDCVLLSYVPLDLYFFCNRTMQIIRGHSNITCILV